MEELSIEQKARAYDEALEKAKGVHNSAKLDKKNGVTDKITDYTIQLIETIFPELKVSDDEKIRKALIWGFKAMAQESETFANIPISSCIAYLEKQREQKHTPKHKIGDTIYYNSFGEVKSMVVSDVVMDGTDNPMYEDKDGNAVFEKDLIEQKLADKAEPKFKQGDWIIFNGLTLCVKRVVKGFYIATSKDGITNGYDWSIDNVARLWSIKDAKNGDVLVLNNEVFIYAHRKQMYSIAVAHCFVDSASGFHFDGEFGYTEKGNSICPATKEQRDTLMKAMTDAGYTFDFEKKELKKIEKNHAEWSEEDEKYFKSIAQALSVLLVDPCYDKIKLEHTAWFQSLKDRYTWRPRDEQLEALVSATENCAYSEYQDCLRGLIGQLKKLK